MLRNTLNSLNKLFETVNWKTNDAAYVRRGSIDQKSVYAGINFHKNSNNKVTKYITVKIGNEVMEEMGWKAGDTLLPMINPDHHLMFRLVKSSSKGYKISNFTNTKHYGIKFKYFGDADIKQKSSTEVEFALNGNSLIFLMKD